MGKSPRRDMMLQTTTHVKTFQSGIWKEKLNIAKRMVFEHV